jgi:hypothetical protein
MIQIFESLDLVFSNMHVSCFNHVISVLGRMAHTSHLSEKTFAEESFKTVNSISEEESQN